MLFTGWEVLTGKNCARGLEYVVRSQAYTGYQTKAEAYSKRKNNSKKCKAAGKCCE